MKKIFFILSFSLFFIACSNDEDDTPPKDLLGKWKIEYYIYDGEKHDFPEQDYLIVFTGNWYVKQFPNFNEKGSPFTLKGKTLQWKTDGNRGSINFKYNYSIKADTLILENLIENSPFIEGTSYYSRQ